MDAATNGLPAAHTILSSRALVYRLGWSTVQDILCEMDVLTHLDGQGVAGSTPAAQRDGELHLTSWHGIS